MPRGVIILALIGTIAFATSTDAQSMMASRITIHLHDYAGTNRQALERAQETVTDVFRKTAVETSWVDPIRWTDVTDTHASHGPNEDITVIVLSSRMLGHKQLPPRALGSAVVGHEGTGRIAYVVASRVDEVAAATGRDRSDIMALVIAHEIGHLLRLPHDRQSDGVMRAVWSLDQLRRIDLHALHFATAQSETIRAAIETAGTPHRPVALEARQDMGQ